MTEGTPRLYTVAEANASLPHLRPRLERLRWLRDEVQRARDLLEILWERLEAGEPVLSSIGERQRGLDDFVDEFTRIAEEIEALGVIVRDLDAGLVDFPARLRGTPIFLCWKSGEREVAFWHGTGEGYAGRKSVAMLEQ